MNAEVEHARNEDGGFTLSIKFPKDFVAIDKGWNLSRINGEPSLEQSKVMGEHLAKIFEVLHTNGLSIMINPPCIVDFGSDRITTLNLTIGL